MREISGGLWHWTARHERIGVEVSSYYLATERVAIDPMLPPGGLEWFEQQGPPEHVLLSNRHHDRHAWDLQQRFGCAVHCVANGVYEIEGRGEVTAFEFGDELPGAITAHEVDAICPDETALHVPNHGALLCADGVVHYGERLGFVPERYMDDPEQTKQKLREAYRPLLDLEFELLLLAHGKPLLSDGRAALREFAQADG
jgi:glyoxylase-like metal-dependent hydrolase (beta-lactamase superfamily II)